MIRIILNRNIIQRILSIILDIFYRKDVQENLKKEKQDFATMKRNCRATKQKNQKLEMELRQQTKKVLI